MEPDELRSFLQDRLLDLNPAQDTSDGSPADIKVITPTIARLSTSPFEVPIRRFIYTRLGSEYPEIDLEGAGSGYADIIAGPAELLLEPFKREQKAFDILYHWSGHVLECPRDNFFIVKDNTFITAKDDVLHGITRNVVMDIARKHFAVEERKITVDELDTADGAFMTSTTKSIVPVVEIDDRKIGGGTMCADVCEIIGHFEKYVAAY